jgi:hypothetical protein
MAYKDPNDERAKAARRKHYHANKEQYFARNKKKKLEMREWLDEIKSKPCMDCGISYPPYVMDFDHRDPELKVSEITRVVRKGSWKQLQDEVDKCDLVCSNCHRLRTHKQRLEQ